MADEADQAGIARDDQEAAPAQMVLVVHRPTTWHDFAPGREANVQGRCRLSSNRFVVLWVSPLSIFPYPIVLLQTLSIQSFIGTIALI
jgi:hypothetical protein